MVGNSVQEDRRESYRDRQRKRKRERERERKKESERGECWDNGDSGPITNERHLRGFSISLERLMGGWVHDR